MAYTNPLLPPFFFFFYTPIKGAWALVPLSYASDNGVARICQQGGQSEGAKRPSGGEDVGSLSHGNNNLWKFVYENGIFLHIKCHY